MPPPQLLQKDSEWPGWGSGAFFALACEQLSHTSGHSIKLKRTRYRQLAPFASRGDQYSFACGSPRCLFSVVFRDTETGTFAVVECALRHNHKPEPRSSEQVKRLEEKLVTLKRGIVEQAAHDLRRMHMSASYRQGYEKDERPGAMPPLLEQQLVFWDLVPVFGETAVKAFEGKMRESHSLVDNYPARSPMSRLPRDSGSQIRPQEASTLDNPRPSTLLPGSPSPSPPPSPSRSPSIIVVEPELPHVKQEDPKEVETRGRDKGKGRATEAEEEQPALEATPARQPTPAASALVQARSPLPSTSTNPRPTCFTEQTGTTNGPSGSTRVNRQPTRQLEQQPLPTRPSPVGQSSPAPSTSAIPLPSSSPPHSTHRTPARPPSVVQPSNDHVSPPSVPRKRSSSPSTPLPPAKQLRPSILSSSPTVASSAAGLQPYLPSIAEDPPSTFATDLDSFVLGLFPSYSSAELNATSSVLDKAGIASVGDLVSLALMEQTSLRQVNEALKHREATADECTALAYVLRAVSSGGEERGV